MPLTFPKLDLRRERAAKNESVFREVNERVNELAEPASFHLFACECEDQSCAEAVVMTAQEYEEVRANSNSFFVLPGHEEPLVDELTQTNDRYFVVHKVGVGATVAKKLDPRNADSSLATETPDLRKVHRLAGWARKARRSQVLHRTVAEAREHQCPAGLVAPN